MARPTLIRYRKVAGKHHVRDGDSVKVYGPGQDDGDVVGFIPGLEPNRKDASWVCLDESAAAAEPQPGFTSDGPQVKHRGGSWYDVINLETGEPINTKALKKADAEEFAANWKPEDGDNDEEGDGDNDEEGDGDGDE